MKTWLRANERTLFWITAALILFAGWGLRDPWPADEPRFMLVAKHMVESGNWLFPMRGNELYPDKPPVFMWIQAVLYALTGSVRFAFLLPSMLSGLAVLWLVRDLGSRLWKAEPGDQWHAGAIASWMLLLTLMFTFQFKRAQIDPLITLWVTIGVYSLMRFYLERPQTWLWLLAFFMCGLGIITKGVGFLPLLMLIPAVYARVKQWNFIRVDQPQWSLRLLAPLALLLPIALWLIPMAMVAYGGNDPMFRAYADNILFKQTAGRYSNPWLHQQPWYYFIETIVLQWLPATLALPLVIGRWRQALKNRDARILLPLAWIVLVVLFFSFSRGKREVYILPALPMFCLIIAPYARELLQGKWLPRWVMTFNALLLLILIGGGAALVAGWVKPLATLGDNAVTVGYLLLSIGLAGLAAGLLLRRVHVTAPLAGTLTAIWLGLSLGAYPLLNDDSSAKGLMDDVARRMPQGSELGLVAWKEQNLLMAHQHAESFGFLRPALAQWHDGAAWALQAPQSRWILTERKGLPRCMGTAQSYYMGLYNRRQWFLIPAAHLCQISDAELREIELDPTKGFSEAFDEANN